MHTTGGRLACHYHVISGIKCHHSAYVRLTQVVNLQFITFSIPMIRTVSWNWSFLSNSNPLIRLAVALTPKSTAAVLLGTTCECVIHVKIRNIIIHTCRAIVGLSLSQRPCASIHFYTFGMPNVISIIQFPVPGVCFVAHQNRFAFFQSCMSLPR
jgi:hypothetical protein